MPKLLLLIVGMPGSGKSVAADMIAEKFDAAKFSGGDIIREEVRSRGLKYSPMADMAIAHWFHTGGREKLISKRIWEKAKRARKRIVVIEGVRAPQQLDYLAEMSGQKPVVIAITAPFRVRHAREHARGRFGKKESEAYLAKRDKSELKIGLGRLMRKADYSINNKGSKEDLEKAVTGLVETILYSEK
jgi:dephospho-CoA kinase